MSELIYFDYDASALYLCGRIVGATNTGPHSFLLPLLELHFVLVITQSADRNFKVHSSTRRISFKLHIDVYEV